MPFDLRHDPLKGHFLAHVLFSLPRAVRQNNLDLHSFAAIEDQVLHRIGKVRERQVESKAVVLRQTVKPAAAPGVLITIKSFLNDRAIRQSAAGVGHQQSR